MPIQFSVLKESIVFTIFRSIVQMNVPLVESIYYTQIITVKNKEVKSAPTAPQAKDKQPAALSCVPVLVLFLPGVPEAPIEGDALEEPGLEEFELEEPELEDGELGVVARPTGRFVMVDHED